MTPDQTSMPIALQDERQGFATPCYAKCRVCGSSFETRSTGRPRTTCSDKCRRHLDLTLWKIRRVDSEIEKWTSELQNRTGQYSVTSLRKVLAELRGEHRVLEAELRFPMKGQHAD